MQRYPLHWPHAWPRTPASARRLARFRAIEKTYHERATGPNGQMQSYERRSQKFLSVADARVRLMRELESLGEVTMLNAIMRTCMDVRTEIALRVVCAGSMVGLVLLVPLTIGGCQP